APRRARRGRGRRRGSPAAGSAAPSPARSPRAQGILGPMSEQPVGQYLAYTFFRVRPEWRLLPEEAREAGKDAFAEVVDEFAPRFETLNAYSTTGVRPETDFFLWKITHRYEDLGELGAALNATPLAGWL